MAEETEPIATLTCRTPGCALEDVPVEITHDASIFICGGCNTEIIDIALTEGES